MYCHIRTYIIIDNEEIENIKLKLELCNRELLLNEKEFKLYKVKYKLNDYKKDEEI